MRAQGTEIQLSISADGGHRVLDRLNESEEPPIVREDAASWIDPWEVVERYYAMKEEETKWSDIGELSKKLSKE